MSSTAMTDSTPFLILVVDDEPPIFDILVRIGQKEFPEAQFVNTRSAQETLDFLDQANTTKPNLILLDIELHQERNGLDLLTDLRARLGNSIPIIMLSVLDEDDKVYQAYQDGAVAYTQKPEAISGWQHYVQTLRDYWYRSAVLPTTKPTK